MTSDKYMVYTSDKDNTMTTINDLQAGKAGEYLVCADLILQGHIAFLSEQGLSFDVIADCDGRLLRIQVKTTRETVDVRAEGHLPFYLFNIRRMGKGGRKVYSAGDVDIFALVTLDTREIGYIPARNVKQTMAFRMSQYEGKYAGERIRNNVGAIRMMREDGNSLTKIANLYGVSAHYISEICGGRDVTDKGRYLKDLTFDKAVSQL